jgi:DNA replicative helicase MCM subunit Mcm2 (Cdc46/Mcm family)
MVGIFLRLLEYHQGILFLTTNRHVILLKYRVYNIFSVQDFDDAFYSRITVGIKYPELDYETRKKVWSNFMSMAKLSGFKVDELAKHDLNGRQIRSVLRLAMALAKKQGKNLKMFFAFFFFAHFC